MDDKFRDRDMGKESKRKRDLVEEIVERKQRRRDLEDNTYNRTNRYETRSGYRRRAEFRYEKDIDRRDKEVQQDENDNRKRQYSDKQFGHSSLNRDRYESERQSRHQSDRHSRQFSDRQSDNLQLNYDDRERDRRLRDSYYSDKYVRKDRAERAGASKRARERSKLYGTDGYKSCKSSSSVRSGI